MKIFVTICLMLVVSVCIGLGAWFLGKTNNGSSTMSEHTDKKIAAAAGTVEDVANKVGDTADVVAAKAAKEKEAATSAAQEKETTKEKEASVPMIRIYITGIRHPDNVHEEDFK